MTKRYSYIEFPPYSMDIESQKLWRGSEQVKLRPKSWSVLHTLVNNAGKLVTKQEILSRVWIRGHVTETALRVCIREIRLALRADDDGNSLVQTEGRLGYRFVGQVKSTPAQWLEAGESKFVVGRQNELLALDTLFSLAVQGSRQCILIEGEAGVGKTALIQLFLSAQIGKENVIVGIGRCTKQLNGGEPYGPIFDALNRICRSHRATLIVNALKKYAPSWITQMPSLLSNEENHLLRKQLGEGSNERMLRELCDALDAICVTETIMFVLEDLHWADTATLEWIDVMARRRERAKFILVGSARSVVVNAGGNSLQELMDELSSNGLCAKVTLPRLNADMTVQYLQSRFQNPKGAKKLANIIFQKGGGNPLFMINAVNLLIGNGSIKIGRQDTIIVNDDDELDRITATIPNTLLKIISQHIEKYEPLEQDLLRLASISGSVFSVADVAANSEINLQPLELQFETLVKLCPFIESDGVAEWPDKTVSSRYRFTHALYQRILYDSVAPARLLSMHLQLGLKLESAFESQLDKVAVDLSKHFYIGRCFEKASKYLHLAGINAHKVNAMNQALNHFKQALDFLQEMPISSERDLMELNGLLSYGPVLAATRGNTTAEVNQVYQRASDLCPKASISTQAFQALEGLLQHRLMSGDLFGAHKMSKRILSMAERTQSPAMKLVAYGVRSNTSYATCKIHDALNYAQMGMLIFRRNKILELGVEYSQHPALLCASMELLSLTLLGRFDQARLKCDEFIYLASDMNFDYSVAHSLGSSNVFHHLNRDIPKLLEQAQKMIDISDKHSFEFWEITGRMFRGLGLAHNGSTSEGFNLVEESLGIFQQTNTKLFMSYYLGIYAEVCLLAKKYELGLRTIKQAFDFIQTSGDYLYEAELYRLKGMLLFESAQGDEHAVTKVVDCFEKSRSVAKQRGFLPFYLRATTSLARIMQNQANIAGAEALLLEAYQLFDEGFEQNDVQEARILLDELATQRKLTPKN